MFLGYKFSDGNLRNDSKLKIIGFLCMFLSHLGYLIQPENVMLKGFMILSFTFFSYQIAIGCNSTTNMNKYLLRLWLFAIISQIPYTLLFDTEQLNILFTFFASVFFILCIKNREYFWVPTILVVMAFLNVEYGLEGVLTTYLLYRNISNGVKDKYVIFLLVLMCGLFCQNAIFFLGGIVLVFVFNNLKVNIHLNKYLFYWLYPIELLIVCILKITMVL